MKQKLAKAKMSTYAVKKNIDVMQKEKQLGVNNLANAVSKFNLIFQRNDKHDLKFCIK